MLNQLLRWCFFIKVVVSSNRVAPATRISAVCLPSVFSALKATVGLVLHKSRKKQGEIYTNQEFQFGKSYTNRDF
jgi:hypothetical protein